MNQVIDFLAGYAFKSGAMENTPSQYQLIKMSNVYKNELRLDRSPSFLSELEPKLAKFILEKDDVVLTLTGTVNKRDYGYSVQIPSGDRFLLNQRLVRLRAIRQKSLKGFVRQAILTNRFFHYFFFSSKGGTGNQSNVGIEDLKDIELYFPSLPEQRKIADFLTAVDGRIQQLTQKKALLEDYKKGVMQGIFAGGGGGENYELGIRNYELEEENAETIPNSNAMTNPNSKFIIHNSNAETIPKSTRLRFKDDDGNDFPDWEEKKLGDLVAGISSGKTKPSDTGEFPVYGSTGLLGRSSNYTHNQECILVARVGANAGLVNRVLGRYSVTDNTLIISFDEAKMIGAFAESFLKAFGLSKLVFGSGQPLITSGQLKTIIVTHPSLPEQTKIADFLSAIDRKIEGVGTQITETQTFKRGLLQQMFV